MSSTAIDTQTLEHIAYKRSKKWANFLNRISKFRNEEEMEIDLIGTNNTSSADDDDELDGDDDSMAQEDDDSMAQEDDDSVEQENYGSKVREVGEGISQNENTSQVISNNSNRGAANIPIKIDDNGAEKCNNDIDMLNQTIPVVVEYERKLRLKGFDQVLNTFDAKKIEKTLGGWLSRQDNAFDKGRHRDRPHGIDYDSNYMSTSCLPINCIGNHRAMRFTPPDENYSENESLHSGDTARYIRSSRNRHGLSRHRPASCTAMTTIKTFRTQQSRRDALREKYNCSDQNDGVLVDELLFRRSRSRHYYDTPLSARHELMLMRNEEPAAGVTCPKEMLHRRKQRQKTRLEFDNVSSRYKRCLDCSDSDQDYRHQRVASHRTAYRCCTLKERIRHRAICCSDYVHNYSRGSTKSSLSSSRSFEDRRHVELSKSDRRPCKRESDCACSKRDKLCSEIRHLADSSTEWLVENSDIDLKKRSHHRLRSPTKLQMICGTEKVVAMSKKKTTQNKKVNVKMGKLQVSTDSIEPNNEKNGVGPMADNVKPSTATMAGSIRKDRKKGDNGKKRQAAAAESEAIIIGTIKKNTKSIDKSNKRQAVAEAADKYSKKKPPGNTKCAKQMESGDGTDIDLDLEMAIELSKQSYEVEQQKKQLYEMQHNVLEQKKASKCAKQSREGAVEQVIVASSSTSTKKTTNSVAKAKKRSDTVASQNCDSHTVSIDLSCTPKSILSKLKPQPYSTKMHKLEKYLARERTAMPTENTFYSNAFNMCNSTAVANDSAKGRQIMKSMPVGTYRPSGDIATNAADQSTESAKKTGTHHTSADSTLPTVKTIKAKPLSRRRRIIQSSDDEDCSLVSSTTVSHQKQLQHRTFSTCSAHNSTQDILLYTPDNRALVPRHSFDNKGCFNITKEHLSTVIGEVKAEKFLRYYQGRRHFDASSTVYYRPPQNSTIAETTDDEVDILEMVDKYGELYESLDSK